VTDMSDEWEIPIELPLDLDGFLSRECPTCKFSFKWFPTQTIGQEQEQEQEQGKITNYFCPRCGVTAGLDKWWTPQQLAFFESIATNAVLDQLTEAIKKWNKPSTGIGLVNIEVASESNVQASKPNHFDYETDMVIVESPCHPQEPIKVPIELLPQVNCLVCGLLFAV